MNLPQLPITAHIVLLGDQRRQNIFYVEAHKQNMRDRIQGDAPELALLFPLLTLELELDGFRAKLAAVERTMEQFQHWQASDDEPGALAGWDASAAFSEEGRTM